MAHSLGATAAAFVGLAFGFLAAPRAGAAEACTNALATSWGRAVTPANCWREYPRPQLVRSGWTSLNGEWDYAVTSVAADEPKAWDGKILVPYPIESPLSGVRRTVTPDDQIWYRRTFEAEPRPGWRTILNFERVDFRASVFVNGTEAADVPHEGGNVPFALDVTGLVRKGANELKVLVWDPTDTHLGGTGKQVLKYWTCFFGASSGIVGGVWLETVPETYLADYRVTTDLAKGTVTVEPEVKGRTRAAEVTVSVSRKGKPLASGKVPAGDPLTLTLPRPLAPWSCDEPNLYDLAFVVTADGREDRVTGYFGLREVGTRLDAKGHRRVTVNGKFTYLLATLDQGWWPDGLLTPPSEDACRFDVDFHKKAGFNAIRKHIKIEPRAFYAHCDRIGVMVLQDIPSFGPDNRQHELSYANKRYAFYRRELKDCVDHLRNHPSVVMWIPYNEGWGQPSADKTRFTNRWLRRYDPTRLIDGPSGWNDYEGGLAQGYAGWANADVADPGVYTDCNDLHCYPGPAMHPADGRRVSFLGEFGGMGVALRGHVQDPQGRLRVLREVSEPTWRGQQERAYLKRMDPLADLVRNGLGGSVYTEAIDQFWELGGFVTFDRALVKFDYAFLRKVHQKVYDAAEEAARTPPPPPATGSGVDWDPAPRILDLGEWPRLKILADGRYAFTYSRPMKPADRGHGAVVRFSSDRGRTWSAARTMLAGFTRPNGADGEAAYGTYNPHLAELPVTHPTHPGRLIASANLRPAPGTRGAPSSVGYAVSDDGGSTWSARRDLLPVAGDKAAKGGRSCWEPFVQVRPDGTLDLYYSDVVTPRPGRGPERTVSRFVSTDGGDTWRGPEIVAYRPGTGAGIPVPLAHGDRLYLAFEAYPEKGLRTPVRPWIALTSARDPWKTPPRFFRPLADAFAGDEIVGAPFLVETANHYVLSAHVSRPEPDRDALLPAQMRVWLMPKDKEGPNGELAAFVPAENPLGPSRNMHWNGLTALGGDEVMATCQRGAQLLLVHGRIRPPANTSSSGRRPVALSCEALAGQDAAWLIVNEDNDHFFKSDATSMTEKGLVDYVDYTCRGPVTHFFMCPSGQRASFDSKTWEPIWKGLDEPDDRGVVSNVWCVNARRLHDQGIDPYAVWIRRCRERGVSPWLSMRMNDTHGMNVTNYFRGTTFCRTRRDLWINPGGKTRYDFCLDFAKKDVRDYTLAHVRELAERYDIDGLEMDWMRMGRNFRYGHEREDGHFLTEFMTEARKALDGIGARRGRRIALGVRTCRDPDLAREKMGMAVADWAKAGLVDLVVPSSFWAADPDIAVGKWIRSIAAANPSVRVVPCIDIITLRKGRESTLTPAAYRYMADRFYSEGAKGVYLFNLPYLGKYASDWYVNKIKAVDYDVADVIFREGLAPETVRSKPREAVEPLHDFPCW